MLRGSEARFLRDGWVTSDRLTCERWWGSEAVPLVSVHKMGDINLHVED